MRILLFCLACIAITSCATLKPSQGPALRLDDVHLGGATEVAFAPDGERMATGGHDGTISVWQVPEGLQLAQARPHVDPVRGIAWRDDETVVTAAEDGRVALWHAGDGEVLRAVQTDAVTDMAYDSERDRVITGHEDGTVRILAGAELTEIARTQVDRPVTAIAYHPQSDRLAVAAGDRVQLLDSDLRIMRRWQSPRDVLGLRFSPDGQELAGGAWFALLVWDLDTGALDVRDTEHFGAIIAMDYAPDGQYLVTIGRHTDGGIRMVDAEDNQVIRRLLAHDACGWSVRVSPDGRYIATASEDESVRLYDLQLPYRPEFHHDP